jgi:hypothetical protein
MNKQIGRVKTFCKAFEGRTDIVRWDVQQIKQEQILKVEFIGKNSPFRQGVRIAIDAGDGLIEVNGQESKAIQLWEDTAPKVVMLKCKSKEGLLSIYNIWDEGRGRQSLAHTSGMILEDVGNKTIYRCNDFGYDTNFGKLIFSIEKL